MAFPFCTQRSKKRIINRHSLFQTRQYCMKRKSCYFGPLRNCFCLTIISEKMTCAFVVVLLTYSCPTAIFRAIRAVIVYPINS